MRNTTLILSILLLSCSPSRPTAGHVCGKIVDAGVGKNCRDAKPEMINARAAKMVQFDLVDVPGKGGHVLSFEADDDYKATVEAYKGAAMLAGPHRYGSEKARIFVQFNTEASIATGNKVRGLIDSL